MKIVDVATGLSTEATSLKEKQAMSAFLRKVPLQWL